MGLKRFVTDRHDSIPDPFSVTKVQKVAVVGSGPAGLSAAWSMAKRGYGVTVFEALPVAGGMLAVGLPDYRLPKSILQRDLDYLEALGIEIRTDSPIQTKGELDDLRDQGYAAIFLAIGAHEGRVLPVSGTNLDGVHIGVSFLRELNMGREPHVGRRVLVLGGGRVALDCARCACRLGASEVHLVCLEARDAMRAANEEIDEAQEEGVLVHNGRSLSRILGEGDRVSAAECIDVASFHFDETGRAHLETIPGSENIYECDTVVLAIGQMPASPFFQEILAPKRSILEIDPETMSTRLKGVFTGGDATGGSGSVIEAISSGKRAAKAMDAFIQGMVYKKKDPFHQVNPAEIAVQIPSGIKEEPRYPMQTRSVTDKNPWEEISFGFSEDAAIAEAARCLNCAGHICREVCPYDAPQFGAEDGARMQMCNFCVDRWDQNRHPICVTACPTRAMDAGPVGELIAKYGETREAEGFTSNPWTKPSVFFKPKKYPPR
jgi:NADPH-dependent glutamate synthase beta subunit-like oxidoreductase